MPDTPRVPLTYEQWIATTDITPSNYLYEMLRIAFTAGFHEGAMSQMDWTSDMINRNLPEGGPYADPARP